VFPQGTRRQKGRNKGIAAAAGTGAARIAFRADAPLVPAAISGTDNLLGLGPIKVAFGPTIDLDDLRGLPVRDRSRIATERLVEAIETLRVGFP
jgi:1-acyl-sn-glycerol-3-phosphate acyltransferase